MAVVSGTAFAIAVGGTSWARVAAWTITYEGQFMPVVSAETKKGVRRVCGPAPWRGTIQGVGVMPSVLPGDGISSAVTFSGLFSTGGTSGVSGNIVIRQVTVQADYESGGPLMWSIEFEGSGQLTEGTVTVSLPAGDQVACAANAALTIDGVAQSDVSRWVVSLVENVAGYRSAETNGYMKFVNGPRDVQAQVDFLRDGVAQVPALGAEGNWVFYQQSGSSGSAVDVKWLKVMAHNVEMRAGQPRPLVIGVPAGLSLVSSAGSGGWVKVGSQTWL